MAEEFEYDPENDEGTNKFLRLPFALCKAHGIEIQDWWRPRDAWNALKRGGVVEEPSEEMKKLLKKLKNERAREVEKKKRAARKKRKEKIKQQMSMEEHIPTTNPTKDAGYIANVKQGNPMSHEQADSGNVNPYYKKGFIGYRTNCQTCVAVYVARTQGYDVTALPNLNNKAIYDLSHDSFGIFKGKNGERIPFSLPARGESKQSFLSKHVEEGGIHAIRFAWLGMPNGHTVIATKKNGEVELYDPQVNETYRGKEVSKYLSRTKKLKSTANLQGATIDKEWADKIMKEKKK